MSNEMFICGDCGELAGKNEMFFPSGREAVCHFCAMNYVLCTRCGKVVATYYRNVYRESFCLDCWAESTANARALA